MENLENELEINFSPNINNMPPTFNDLTLTQLKKVISNYNIHYAIKSYSKKKHSELVDICNNIFHIDEQGIRPKNMNPIIFTIPTKKVVAKKPKAIKQVVQEPIVEVPPKIMKAVVKKPKVKELTTFEQINPDNLYNIKDENDLNKKERERFDTLMYTAETTTHKDLYSVEEAKAKIFYRAKRDNSIDYEVDKFFKNEGDSVIIDKEGLFKYMTKINNELDDGKTPYSYLSQALSNTYIFTGLTSIPSIVRYSLSHAFKWFFNQPLNIIQQLLVFEKYEEIILKRIENKELGDPKGYYKSFNATHPYD